MPRLKRRPEYLLLHRQQLDARKELNSHHPIPKDGWIRAVRTALGMSAVQLGKRLGVSQQAVAGFESGERAGTISLTTLSKVAEALDCDLTVSFTPKTSLEQTMRRQATAKARDERNRVMHSMRLEGQDSGVGQVMDVDKAAELWMITRIAKLWD